MRKKLLFIIIGIIPFFLFSQVTSEEILNPSMNAELFYAPKKSMTDSLGTYRYTALKLGFNMPIYSKFSQNPKTGNSTLSHIFFSLDGKMSLPEISFVYPNHLFIDAGARLTAIYIDGNKNSWLGTFHTSMVEDNYTISSPGLRYTGAILYKRKKSDRFSYHIGVTYSYVFGQGFVLPLLGFQTPINKKTLLIANLPLSISILSRPDNKTAALFYIRAVGNEHKYSSTGFLPDSVVTETLKFRISSIQLGLTGKFNAGRHFLFTARTGFNFGTKLDMLDENTKLMSTGQVVSGFLGVGVIYKFGIKGGKWDKEPSVDVEDIPEELIFEP
jgi:hypothetical protein